MFVIILHALFSALRSHRALALENLTFPLNLGVAKTFLAGKTPIKTTLQAQYFVTRPDLIAPSWGVFFQITPVVSVPW